MTKKQALAYIERKGYIVTGFWERDGIGGFQILDRLMNKAEVPYMEGGDAD